MGIDGGGGGRTRSFFEMGMIAGGGSDVIDRVRASGEGKRVMRKSKNG